jgi:hypothetical protein
MRSLFKIDEQIIVGVIAAYDNPNSAASDMLLAFNEAKYMAIARARNMKNRR